MSEMLEWQAAEVIGERIFDMADRLVPTDKIVLGTVASCSFEIDGVWFDCTLRVKPPSEVSHAA